MEYKLIALITAIAACSAVFYAYKAIKKSFEAFIRSRMRNNVAFSPKISIREYLFDVTNYISPSFYAAFTCHYWQNNQLVFEHEGLLHAFLSQYNAIFWGKNTGFDFILAENIDACNYTKTEKHYNGMTFIGNSENAIPQGYEFVNVFIYQYKVQK